MFDNFSLQTTELVYRRTYNEALGSSGYAGESEVHCISSSSFLSVVEKLVKKHLQEVQSNQIDDEH